MCSKRASSMPRRTPAPTRTPTLSTRRRGSTSSSSCRTIKTLVVRILHTPAEHSRRRPGTAPAHVSMLCLSRMHARPFRRMCTRKRSTFSRHTLVWMTTRTTHWRRPRRTTAMSSTRKRRRQRPWAGSSLGESSARRERGNAHRERDGRRGRTTDVFHRFCWKARGQRLPLWDGVPGAQPRCERTPASDWDGKDADGMSSGWWAGVRWGVGGRGACRVSLRACC
mmetsp:Transcript_28986/g.75143  ORF Transcript_28986/g.75143 Transcript_28986/m.75143 type:complete len:224 (-) Transcript_28986:152-823(-)